MRATRPFGEEVRVLCVERKMTRRALCRVTGFDPGYLTRVMQAKKPVGRSAVAAVTVALGLPADYFRESRQWALEDAMRDDPELVDVFYATLRERGCVALCAGRVPGHRIGNTSRGVTYPARSRNVCGPR